MDFDSILEQQELLRLEIIKSCTVVPAAEVGLDSRCGAILVGEDFVASTSPGSLDYYGGFEYVDAVDRMLISDLGVYSSADERVSKVIQRAEDYNEAA